MTQTKEQKPSVLSNKIWVRALLAGTCLGGAGVAQAVTVSEPPEFAHTLSDALLAPLPFGTTDVSGNAADSGNLVVSTYVPDVVDFASLVPGSAFTLLFTGGTLNYSVTDSSGVTIGGPAQNAVSSATFIGNVPGDGQLVAQVSNAAGSTYTIQLTGAYAAAVPEPSAPALALLGVAGLGLAARSHKKLPE